MSGESFACQQKLVLHCDNLAQQGTKKIASVMADAI